MKLANCKLIEENNSSIRETSDIHKGNLPMEYFEIYSCNKLNKCFRSLNRPFNPPPHTH